MTTDLDVSTSAAEKTYTEDELVFHVARWTRHELARVMGQTAYGGDRDYYETLGYPKTLGIADYLQRYERQDIAARIVDLPAQDTWKKPPLVTQNEQDDTPFCIAWNNLVKRLGVWAKLSEADKLSGIGHYGILLVGLRDKHADGTPKKLSEPVVVGSLASERDVLYLHAFSEERAKIATWEDDPQSRRYGLLLTYDVKVREDRGTEKVHWTRALYLSEGAPRLQRVFNRLDDLMKLVGGAAEATWLSMRPPLVITNRSDYAMSQTDDAKTERLEEIRRFVHDQIHILMMEGIDAQQVGASTVVDPRGLFEVEISLVAAASGIPQRTLLGSAQGRLASAEYDAKQWAGQIVYRQTSYAEPEILRPFIGMLQRCGVLPFGDYEVGKKGDDGEYHWPPIIEMTEAEQAAIVGVKAGVVRQVANTITGELP
ncbi:MAG: DUF1073 domain-containing protein, partial [Chloroflexi bacterium]|nr:DUF1073 domain-containing protein [Chloroflexota bacterium]